jgi:hypothetical protein
MREWSIISREIVPTEWDPGGAGRGSLDLPLTAAEAQRVINDSA